MSYKHKQDNYDEVVADFDPLWLCSISHNADGSANTDIARKRMFLTVYTNQQLSDNGDILGTIAFLMVVDVYDPGTKSYIGFSVKKVLSWLIVPLTTKVGATLWHTVCPLAYTQKLFNNLVEKRLLRHCISLSTRISDGDDATRMKREWKNRHGIARES